MKPVRPFRFGITAGGVASGTEWRDLARRAEASGFSTLFIADHYVNNFAPLSALMAAAAATTTLRVGSSVFDNDFRHPALLAKEVATLDLLSDGRFECGMGAGWLEAEYRMINLGFDPASVRVARLGEAIQIVKQFFTQETVNFSGEYYTVTDLPATPKPTQQPHPPIFIGGGGKRVLSLAAREADIIGVHIKVNADGTGDFAQQTAEGIHQKLDWIREAAGDRFDQIELNVLVRAAITDHPEEAAAAYAQRRNWNVSPQQMLDTLNVLYGSVDQVVERLQKWRETYGISYILIASEQDPETLAPVISQLAGR
jgi:probable F420-dependent oxidoreductase